MDIETLVLNEQYSFGDKTHASLPKIEITAALVTDKAKGQFTSVTQVCSVALSEFSPKGSVLDLDGGATVCSAVRKCMNILSKDIVKWVAPQV